VPALAGNPAVPLAVVPPIALDSADENVIEAPVDEDAEPAV
jgi:hypothetical protein